MVHWDGMDKRDIARVWDSLMVYHLVPLRWDRMDKRDSTIVFGTVSWSTILSRLVHWDGMDKRDNARVWDSPMVYHLVPLGTLG